MKNKVPVKKNYWATYDYPENKEIGKKLNNGDRQTIAKLTGFGYNYVRQVLRGKRHNKIITEMARKLILSRELIVGKIQENETDTGIDL